MQVPVVSPHGSGRGLPLQPHVPRPPHPQVTDGHPEGCRGRIHRCGLVIIRRVVRSIIGLWSKSPFFILFTIDWRNYTSLERTTISKLIIKITKTPKMPVCLLQDCGGEREGRREGLPPGRRPGRPWGRGGTRDTILFNMSFSSANCR